jgi:triosephosphate isomerase (TIM)
MTRKPLFAANWKMNKLPGEGAAFVSALTELVEPAVAADLMIAPQAPMLAELNTALASSKLPCKLGAQNCHWLPTGAHTGENSPELLSKLGVQSVIIGHSERRILYREPDAEVALRVKAALERGMDAILCVGETKEQFDSGKSKEVVLNQLKASLHEVPTRTDKELVVAYEPVWAIGTGLAATPEIVKEMHAAIRKELTTLGYSGETRILYGGSTTPENIASFMTLEDVDGALIGGTSLDPGKYAALIKNGLV